MRSYSKKPNTQILTNNVKNSNRLYRKDTKWLPSSPGLATNGQPLRLRLNKCGLVLRGPI